MKTTSFGLKFTLISLLAVIEMIFSFTPLGTIQLPIETLAITLNIIPIAVAALICGPVGGSVVGSVFGLFSFLQCFGIGVGSAFGAELIKINLFFCFLNCVVPRLIAGLGAGFIYRFMRNRLHQSTVFSGLVTGFCTAVLNTVLFMSALLVFFGSSDFIQEMMGGQNVITFVIAFVGINAIVEMTVSTIVTGLSAFGLSKTEVIKI